MLKQTINILLIFLCIKIINAQDSQGISVRPISETYYEVNPRSTVTTFFNVSNHIDKSLYLESVVELPTSWQLITQELPYDIYSHENDIRMISFFIPSATPASLYEITYRVISREYPALSDYFTIQIMVLPIKKLSIQIINKPINVIAGETYQIDIAVLNQSNVAESIELFVESNKNFPVTLDTNQIELSPGEIKEMSITIHTIDENISKYNHIVNIKAKFKNDERIYDQIRESIEIIPRIGKPVDVYHRFPVSMNIAYAIQNNGQTVVNALNTEISGQGTFKENSNHHLAFRFRGPDTYTQSLYLFGNRDWYSMEYWNNRFGIHIGDKSFTLSKLTEYSRYGRGLEGNINWNKFNFGAFFQKARYYWSGGIRKEWASYLNYQLNQNTLLSINYLKKFTSTQTSDIASMGAKIKYDTHTNIEMEYAVAPVSEKISTSYLIKVSRYQDVLSYNFNVIYADSEFPGYYRNTDFYTADVSLQIFERLRLKLNVHRDRKQYEVDSLVTLEPVSKYNAFGFDYELNKNTRFNLDYITQIKQDQQDNKLFDYYESSFRLNIHQKFRKVTLLGAFYFGRTLNNIMDTKSDMHRYEMSVNYYPNTNHSFQGYVYFDNNQRYGSNNKRLTLGLNISSYLTKKVMAYLTYQNYYSPEEYYMNRNLFEFKLEYFISNSHNIALRCRKTLLQNTTDREDFAFRMDYKMNLNVPVSKKISIGQLHGRIIHSETQQPVEDVIIRMNEYTAVSNLDGYFNFPSLKPGSYLLVMDKSRIGLNHVVLQNMPMTIEIIGGEEKEIQLDIVEGASVTGQVMLYMIVNESSDHFSSEEINNHTDEFFVAGDQTNNSDTSEVTVTNGKIKSVPDRPLPNIMVEMKKGDIVLRRITRTDGQFEFDQLQPGHWTLKCYTYNLLESQYLEEDQFEFDIQSGESKYFTFKVLPERRRIQFIETDDTIIQ